MTHRKRFCSMVPIVFAMVCSNLGGQTTERVPILIDSDIGTDIDDAFALGLALGSDELDLRGVTTVGDDARQKAMMVCRFLTATGRRHTRVAVGAQPQPSRPITDQAKYHYHPDPLFGRTTKPEEQAAVDFLHARLKQQPGRVTLVAIGPLTNIARLIETHDDAAALLRRVVLLESNVALDVAAARKVFESAIPLVVIPSAACNDLMLDDAGIRAVFSPGTPLTRQVETLYQMWDRHNPPLDEALAVAICFDEQFAEIDGRSLVVDGSGQLTEGKSKPRARVVTGVNSAEFANWYARRMGSLVAPKNKPSRVFHDDKLPHRVHVAEDFDHDVERFWWMSGKPETKLLPPGSRRACRGVLTHDFDDLLMASREMYTAVIFNPVPGPPMGKNTRLKFRYWLKGTDTLRVQIYSLTNGYHRHLVVKNLPRERWQSATVDMTEARRADGTGGPLGENERIDDIQFYADPDAELVIDDIVLYDAADEGEQRPFPKRVMFTGIFDTGKQGEHWPGDFAILSDAGNFWRAAQSVENPESGRPWIRMHLRGQRTLGQTTRLSFRYRLTGADNMRVRLRNSETGQSNTAGIKELKIGEWAQSTIEFATADMESVDEVYFLLNQGGELLLDDVLLYE